MHDGEIEERDEMESTLDGALNKVDDAAADDDDDDGGSGDAAVVNKVTVWGEAVMPGICEIWPLSAVIKTSVAVAL